MNDNVVLENTKSGDLSFIKYILLQFLENNSGMFYNCSVTLPFFSTLKFVLNYFLKIYHLIENCIGQFSF